MYQLLDAGDFQKLEQVGPYRFVRPAAQAVWRPSLDEKAWKDVDAVFFRNSGGDGRWELKSRKLPDHWHLDVPGLGRLVIRLTDFGHLGIFPEQHANWATLTRLVQERSEPGKEFPVLNLFAYTGGSSLAAARGGAHVAHVDASKTSVSWARENAAASGLHEKPIRWLVDDVQKFVARELRRGTKYRGIILDPPSYGRGPKGEIWKIETMLPPLLNDLKQLLADDYVFFLLSAHSEGYTPLALTNLVHGICDLSQGVVTAEEMVVHEQKGAGRPLPSGASCLYVRTP